MSLQTYLVILNTRWISLPLGKVRRTSLRRTMELISEDNDRDTLLSVLPQPSVALIRHPSGENACIDSNKKLSFN